MQSQSNQSSQSNQFTQSELQQLKAILSRNIQDFEERAQHLDMMAKTYMFGGGKENKDFYFARMQLQLNKAKKLAKLQKKVKNLISGKESS